MRKTIVFLLLILLFSVSVSADNGYTDEKTELLSVLNIIDENQPDKEEVVTRGEFAKSVVRFMGIESMHGVYDGSFEDVTEYNDTCNEIYYLKLNNIISGAEDGNFYPDMPITKKHAAIILARVLGYGDLPGNIESYASGLSIITMTNDALSRGELTSLLYKALKSNVVVRDLTAETKFVNGEEYLYKVFGVCEGKGIVRSNSLTTLDGTGSVIKDGIKIDNHVLSCEDFNADGFLGMTVDYYYISSDWNGNVTGDDVLICMSAQNRNNIKEILGRDIISFDGRTLKYGANGTVKTLEIKSVDDVIYNGVACPDYVDEYIWSKSGKITYINNGSESACIKVEKYENDIVSLVTDEVIYLKDGSDIKLNNFDEDTLFFYDKEGSLIDEIPVDSVLSLYYSADRSVLKVVCSTDIIDNAKIIGINDNYIETETVKVYVNSAYTGWNNSIDRTITYKLYLDAFGEVAKIEKVFVSGIFAYLLDIGDNIGREPGIVYAKLLLETGNIETVECNQRFSLNGSRVNVDALRGRLTYSKDGNSIVEQLITYKRNEEGKLTSINTADNRDRVYGNNYTSQNLMDDMKIDKFKIAYQAGSSDTYKTATKSFGLKCPADEETKVFFISTDPKAYNNDYFWAGNISEFIDNQKVTSVIGYKTTAKFGNAEAMVVYGVETDGAISDDTRLSAVKKVVKTINEDDEERTRVTFVTNGKIVAYNLRPDVAEEFDLNVGDIVRFATDRKYEISEIKMICEVKDNGEKVPFDGQFNSTNNNYFVLSDKNGDRFRAACGIVYDYKDGLLCLSRGAIKDFNNTNPIEYYKGINSAFICVIDDEDVTAGTDADIMQYSKVFITTRYDAVRDVFIYK